MKIVILDAYATNPGDIPWDGVTKYGQTTIYDRTPPELIAERIGDADAVISSKVVIGRDIFERCPNLKYIGLLSTGYNVIDIQAAKENGVAVCNVPEYSTQAVSQMAFALLLEICNLVGMHSEAVYDGAWEKAPDWCFWLAPHTELLNKTMGIIGFGSIGRCSGHIANAFGMKVLAYARHKRPELETESTHYVDSTEEIFEKSDVILTACPLTDDTREIIRAENIAKMKDGVIIINIARGGLINEKDLAEALNSGKVRGAGVDVASTEPIRHDNALLGAKNCYITPHIAWVPYETRVRMLRIVSENLGAFAAGHPQNVVNP
ncbi:MAG: D-2-hydroxyacid dehydrogenase [Oscillospiraceae bacterium]|nr:D-2-hydroxyacid dehydrogenase [Oscillospiraceae bacterium]